GANAILRTLDQAAIALANEMVGGAQMLLESAVNYAKLGVQFGRTIGSFQAIKHKLADMLLDLELAKSAAYYAAQAAAANDSEWPALASLAKAAASETYLHIAADCIQIHGGIGFTSGWRPTGIAIRRWSSGAAGSRITDGECRNGRGNGTAADFRPRWRRAASAKK